MVSSRSHSAIRGDNHPEYCGKEARDTAISRAAKFGYPNHVKAASTSVAARDYSEHRSEVASLAGGATVAEPALHHKPPPKSSPRPRQVPLTGENVRTGVPQLVVLDP